MLKQTFQQYKAMLLADPRTLRVSRSRIKKMKKAFPVMEVSDLQDDSQEYKDFIAANLITTSPL